MRTIQQIQKELYGTSETYSTPKTKRLKTKHNASKKGHKHTHNLSYGQKKHADFMNPANWK